MHTIIAAQIEIEAPNCPENRVFFEFHTKPLQAELRCEWQWVQLLKTNQLMYNCISKFDTDMHNLLKISVYPYSSLPYHCTKHHPPTSENQGPWLSELEEGKRKRKGNITIKSG